MGQKTGNAGRQSLLHAGVVAAVLGGIALLAPALDQPGLVMTSLTHITFYDAAIAVMLAVSLNLILGMTGQFSLGHAGFVAAGAYVAAVLAGRPEFMLPQLMWWHGVLHLPMWAAFSCVFVTAAGVAAGVAAVLGLLVGLPTLRLRGDYLAIATLGFGEIVATLITNSDYLGRTFGLRLDSMRNLWLTQTAEQPHPLAGEIRQYLADTRYLVSSFWVLGLMFLTVALVRNIKYSTTGRALLAIREDPLAAEAVGIPTVRYKITAFVMGAGMAGVAGALYSHYTALNPQNFRFMTSVTIVLFVILGGQGSITGSATAAVALTVLPVAIQRNTVLDASMTEKWRMVAYALLIVLAMLFRPKGIFGRFEMTDLVRWAWRRAKGQGAAGVAGTSGPELRERVVRAEIPGEKATDAVVLEAKGVGMSFGGVRAVDDFNLALRGRELVGLIGPNGAGKTTVFNVLTGVYRPTDGQIAFHGRALVGLRPHAISQAGVARTFQNIRLFGNLSVVDNVMIAQHAHHQQGIPAAVLRTPGFFREEALSREVAMELLGIFGLGHLAEERANALSYGDQRRLEIARALAARPRVLLLDEPAAGMNPTEKRRLMEMIRWIRDEFALTILLIEHDMKVVMGVCERIVVLDYGRTIATGTPEEIRKNPAVIEAYLGASAKQG